MIRNMWRYQVRIVLVGLLVLFVAIPLRASDDPCDDYRQCLQAQVDAQKGEKDTAQTDTLRDSQQKKWGEVMSQCQKVYYDGDGARRQVPDHENFTKHGDDRSLGFPEFLDHNYGKDWGDKV